MCGDPTYRTYGAETLGRMVAIDILLLRRKVICFGDYISVSFNPPYMMNDFLYRTHVILSILRKSYWHRNWLLFNEINKEMFIVVTRIFQQTFLKMNRFAFALHLGFIASILVAGCTAPAHLRHRSHPSTSELSPDERMQQTIGRWKGVHISKAIQKWGSPDELNGDGTGWQIYIWQVPVQMFLSPQQHRVFSRRHANGLNGVAGTILQTDYAYELVFYTRPDGIIDKTLAKRSQNSSSKSANWR